MAKVKPPTLRCLEDLGPHISIEQVVNVSEVYGAAVDNSNDEHAQRSGVFHPSSIGYCRRSQVLQFLKTPPTDRRSKRANEIFELGHAIHDIVQSRLHDLQKVLGPQEITVEFRDEVGYDKATDQLYLEFGIGGTTDGLLSFVAPDWEQHGVVEVKSINDKRFDALLKMTGVYPSNLMQAHLYAWRFQLPIIWVWYYCKDNSKREVRPFFFSTAIFDEALNYFVECGDFVTRGELPPREESYFECSDCVYRTMCGPKILARKAAAHAAVPKMTIRRK